MQIALDIFLDAVSKHVDTATLNKLKTTNQRILKLITSDDDPAGWLYIIQLREHIVSQQPIYKVGRTKDVQKRLKMYAKGSILLHSHPVQNAKDAEHKLLSLLNHHHDEFIQENTYGREYFSGNYQRIKEILDWVAQHPQECTREPIQERNIIRLQGYQYEPSDLVVSDINQTILIDKQNNRTLLTPKDKFQLWAIEALQLWGLTMNDVPKIQASNGAIELFIGTNSFGNMKKVKELAAKLHHLDKLMECNTITGGKFDFLFPVLNSLGNTRDVWETWKQGGKIIVKSKQLFQDAVVVFNQLGTSEYAQLLDDLDYEEKYYDMEATLKDKRYTVALLKSCLWYAFRIEMETENRGTQDKTKPSHGNDTKRLTCPLWTQLTQLKSRV